MNKNKKSLEFLTNHELASLYKGIHEKPLIENLAFAIELLTEIGNRFLEEYQHNANELHVGDLVWYVNTEESIVERGFVTEISQLGSYFDIRFDEGDIDTFDLKYFGKVVFLNKTEADIVLGRYKIDKEMT